MYDLFIIGGGINGCGIARDAAGRGLSVALAERDDLASATSSASTKLFHGGLRYLEYFEFRLVREALHERELLLRAMPHIARPMRFILPWSPAMRFDGDTPTSRLLSSVLPFLKGRRPAWLIRLGLFLYDSLGGRKLLPGTRRVALEGSEEGAPLQPRFAKAWEYSDCTVDDARLVVLNACDAAARGARIMTRTEVTDVRPEGGHWRITTTGTEGPQEFRAKALVNAAGPWVDRVLAGILRLPSRAHIRLVRGSHIVLPQLFAHQKSYFLQGEDGRIIFAIPWRGAFTLIGTTDQPHAGADTRPECTPAERDYLLAFANRYFRHQLTPEDVLWSYSGVRPLYDDGARSATAATRDYVLELDFAPNPVPAPAGTGAPVLSVFGGKITTYRRLAESALARLGPHLPAAGAPWTAGAPLPGGDFPVDGLGAEIDSLCRRYPFLGRAEADRLVSAYGTLAAELLGPATSRADLGTDFGAGLSEAELRWMTGREFARSAEDVLWRRSKLGMKLSPAETARLDAWFANAG